MTRRTCTEAGCDRPAHGLGLCAAHYARRRTGSTRVGPIVTTATTIVGDDMYVACPDDLLALVAAAVELDARAIVRAIWPHLLEAKLAGVEPFTLEQVAS